jgi:hypothetical protein
MSTVQAVFQNGVFTPEAAVNLEEGTRVLLRVEAVKAPTTASHVTPSPFLPDPPLEAEDQLAPYDLPMPTNGVKVKARDVKERLPDPPVLVENDS